MPDKSIARFHYLDILRIAFSVMIVGVHVSALNMSDVATTSFEWQTMNIYNCISILAVPLFFMVSGALFLQEASDLNYKKLYLKNILHLAIAYHFGLIFYNLLPFLRGQAEWNIYNLKYGFLNDLLLGKGIYHLWFLPQLILLYILSPILKEAFRKKEICRYFLILFSVFGAFLPMLLLFDFPYKVYVESYYNRSSLTMLTGYIGYFVLGHYLHSFGVDLTKKWKRILLWCLGIAGIVVTLAGCSLDAIAKGYTTSILNTPFTLACFMTCLCTFALCKHYLSGIKVSKKGLISTLGGLTFGIYLLHPYILQLFEPLHISTLLLPPVIMIPVLIVAVYIVCALIIWIIKKIPILGKWIV